MEILHENEDKKVKVMPVIFTEDFPNCPVNLKSCKVKIPCKFKIFFSGEKQIGARTQIQLRKSVLAKFSHQSFC